MRNNYEYIDPDYSYTDPEIGVLRNLGGITNHDDLVNFESIAVTKRRNELIKQSIDLNPPDNPEIYERYMSGTIDGDIPKLQDLLLDLMNKGAK